MMKSCSRGRYALTLITAALLAACGGSQPPIAPGAMAQTPATAVRHSAASHVLPAASYDVLYSFTNSPDGAGPPAPLTNVNGTLYGITTYGGSYSCGCGTVYSITASGDEKVLHSFAGGYDPGYPTAGLLNVNGTLYGTTRGGGYGGTVYSISTSDGTVKVLHIFSGRPDGLYPEAALIEMNGVLYGTTALGGAECNGSGGCGTVYTISASGVETVLHSFAGGSDGKAPYSGLINVGGTLYGTTVVGGAHNAGTFYSINSNGEEKVLYSFGAYQGDGGGPLGDLINVDGTLYGTTEGGGAHYHGTVYSISTTGEEKVVYSFRGKRDGAIPRVGVINIHGMLYGTTYGGGGMHSNGTVYRVSMSGAHKVLHAFGGQPTDGGHSYGLVNLNGILYGTTYGGGGSSRCKNGCGTVFALMP